MASIWQESYKAPEFTKLKGNIKTDVAIIGGGIAGILTAYLLEKQGVEYVLLEKDKILGSTTRNTTAKLTYQHGLIYDKLAKSKGDDNARAYYLANKQAYERMCELCKETDCDFEQKDSYVYSVDTPDKLERELKVMNRIGLPAEFVNKVDLPIRTAGAVCVRNQAQFNPLKLLSGLAQGLNIYENTKVTQMKGLTAVTDAGSVRADRIIVCTHFPFINKHGLYFLKLYQHRSYVIALENAKLPNGIFIDENEKGLSFRSYKDLLLLGGGSHRTGKPGGSYNELRQTAKVYYPMSKEVCSWATQDCMSLDGMPYIGKYSLGSDRIYTATGFNKWGMSSSMLGAMLLCDAVTGRKNDFAQLFSPSRSMLTPQLFSNCFSAVSGIVTPSEKRCPHMGCALKWNSQEHTWDCSCHGSRFTDSGKVINNPANADADFGKQPKNPTKPK